VIIIASNGKRILARRNAATQVTRAATTIPLTCDRLTAVASSRYQIHFPIDPNDRARQPRERAA